MCTDDYEFRHYTSTRPKQCRRFVFIDEDQIEKTFLVNISQFQQDNEVGLCKIIFHLSGKGLIIVNRRFYWPKYNVSVEPGDYCKVPFSALSDKQIVFHSFVKQMDSNRSILPPCFSQMNTMDEQISQKKQQTDDGQNRVSLCDQFYSCTQCVGDDLQNEICIPTPKPKNQQVKEESSSNQQQQKSDQHLKRIKQPERQIRQVILAVKKWRKLYQSKRLNLTKAAKVIGISKKSLDDYFLVLRVGEILGFDYESNMDSKMGDLRAFIRTFNHKITGKLTKEVKCFELVPDFDIDHIIEQERDPSISSHTEFSEH